MYLISLLILMVNLHECKIIFIPVTEGHGAYIYFIHRHKLKMKLLGAMDSLGTVQSPAAASFSWVAPVDRSL